MQPGGSHGARAGGWHVRQVVAAQTGAMLPDRHIRRNLAVRSGRNRAINFRKLLRCSTNYAVGGLESSFSLILRSEFGGSLMKVTLTVGKSRILAGIAFAMVASTASGAFAQCVGTVT